MTGGTALALRNVQHARARSLAALFGVSFAILLVFMQLGFRSAAERSATLLYDALDFDVVVCSPQYMFVARPREFPRALLERARAVPGVASARRLLVGWGEWRNPHTGLGWGMLVLGVDPGEPPFREAAINELLPRLTVLDTALVDSFSRPEYGPQEPGARGELGGHRLRLVGRYAVGTGFVAGATVLTSPRTFLRAFPARSADAVGLGLVKVRPGASAEAVARQLDAVLGPSAQALTRAELSARERHYWLDVKPIGIMFTSGVVVAFLVGAVILYQVLASEVQNRLREYATLKALGYPDRFVSGVVFQQALIFAAVGFLPAWLWALLLYALVRHQAYLPLFMEGERVLGVAALAVAMSLGASFLAVRKLRQADPADLF